MRRLIASRVDKIGRNRESASKSVAPSALAHRGCVSSRPSRIGESSGAWPGWQTLRAMSSGSPNLRCQRTRGRRSAPAPCSHACGCGGGSLSSQTRSGRLLVPSSTSRVRPTAWPESVSQSSTASSKRTRPRRIRPASSTGGDANPQTMADPNGPLLPPTRCYGLGHLFEHRLMPRLTPPCRNRRKRGRGWDELTCPLPDPSI
jgi:hypothetical protein